MTSVHDSYDIDLLPGLKKLEQVALTFETRSDTSALKDKANAVTGFFVSPEGSDVPIEGWERGVLEAAGFSGKAGQTFLVPAPAGANTILVGLDASDVSVTDAYRESGALLARCRGKGRDSISLVLPEEADGEQLEALVEGVLLGAYSYDTFKTESDDDRPNDLKSVAVISSDGASVSAEVAGTALKRARALARAAYVTRDLVNAPPAHLNPATLAQSALALAPAFGFEAEEIDAEQLAQMGCGGVIGVNRGSKHAARLVKLRYGTSDEPALAMVGKGITFDSGGLSLKPATAMQDMKTDMGGAAAILGAFCAFGDLSVRGAVHAWLPITDNMISGDSMRVGEVITARNGKTVEVTNTDAEGRLILMDALALAAETEPRAIVDVATLTGAQIIALGPDMAAIMGNDSALLDEVERAADASGDAVWELPLHKPYMKILDSRVADLANANMSDRAAGTVTAGLFLSNFVGEIPWVHIDIAGPSSISKVDRWSPAGGTGYGARLLARLADEQTA